MPAAPEVEPASEDPAELLEDVRYLLREAVRDHEAGYALEAEQRWGAAVDLWQQHLSARAAGVDRLRALELEYALGRLGDVLKSGKGRAAPAWKRLDDLLLAAESLVVIPEPEPAPGAPTEAP